MSNKILITIGTRDRPTELALLLNSLRTQTYKYFDIMILDDAGGTPITNYYFIPYTLNRLKLEGHNVILLRNDISSGVSKMRQQLMQEGLKYDYELFVRIDDDSVAESNYIEQLLKVIDAGYDIASGVVPTFAAPELIRRVEDVEPIIGYCELNNKGELIANFDDCGFLYDDEVILPSPHFRSCAMIKREVFEAGVDYDNRLSKNGFREEQYFSWKAITAGFKIGCNTKAICWHLMTPSGGERDTMNLGAFNQEQFEIFTKKLFKDKGDFLKQYYDKLKVKPKKFNKLDIASSANLVYNKSTLKIGDMIK